MAKKQSKRQRFKHKLIDKYRLIILNEDTYEEKLTFRLNRLNVFIIGGTFSILLVVGTIFLIAFTPVREYIPGYSSPKLKRTATELVYKTDSLEQVIKLNNAYIGKIKAVLNGEVEELEYDEDSILRAFEFDKDTMNLMPSDKDIEFREDIEALDRFSIFSEAKKSTEIVFFAPVSGTITDGFNPDNKHFAVDIAVEMGTPVKSVADGTVIFAEWTATTGHVVIVKHAAGFTSIYKHNTATHKEQGDLVKSGEVIASAGDTGELSTGPHLHFELWSEGYPVDPTKYIAFE